MAQLQPLDLSWLGGLIGGAARSGRATNEGGSAFGGKRTLLKDMLEGEGNATDEQFASDAKKARSLRTYLAELDPTLKDKVQAMGLEGLEGHAMSLAEKRRKEQDNLKSQQEYLQMLATGDALNERRQAGVDRQAGQAAAGRYLQAYAQQPPEGLRAPGYDVQSAALAAAGPDLARGANLGALLQFLPQGAGNPMDLRRLALQERGLDLEQGRLDAEMRRLTGGTGGTAAAAKPNLVRVTEKDAQGNTVTRQMTQDEYAAHANLPRQHPGAQAQMEAEFQGMLNAKPPVVDLPPRDQLTVGGVYRLPNGVIVRFDGKQLVKDNRY